MANHHTSISRNGHRSKDAFRAGLIIDAAIWKKHLIVAAGVFVAALVLYISTAVSYAIAGDPASNLEKLMGLAPDTAAQNFVFRGIFKSLLAITPKAHVQLASSVYMSLLSSLAVSMLFLFIAQFLYVFVDKDHLARVRKTDFQRRLTVMSTIGGLISATSFALCAPFWYSATQVFHHSFYLFWFLLALVVMLRFVATRKLSILWSFLALYSLGMSQTSCFIGWCPVVYLFVFYVLWTSRDINRGVLVSFFTLAFVPAVVMLLVGAYVYVGSSGWAVRGGQITVFMAFKELLRYLSSGVTGTLPQTLWIYLIGLTILPWMASLIVVNRAINGDKNLSMILLHVAIAIVSISVLLEMRFTPWQLYNVHSLQILPYAMVSMSAGYVAAYVFGIADFHIMDRTREIAAKAVTAILMAAVLIFSAVNNYQAANLSNQKAIWRYCSKVVDSLGGRKWLFTNGLFDSNIRLCAATKGIELTTINIFSDNSNSAQALYKDSLPSVRLKNMSTIGMMTLLEQWISSRPNASEEIATMMIPDFWHIGHYEDLPTGLVFTGVSPEKAAEIAKDPHAFDDFLTMIDEFDRDLALVPKDAYYTLRRNTEKVRNFVSFVGNNIGYLLEKNGDAEGAFKFYDRVHKFDPDNISCFLNLVNIIRSGQHPELKESIRAEMEEFQNKTTSQPNVWTLASICGYIANPHAYAMLGWTWVLSGQPEMAVKSFESAISNITPDPGKQAQYRIKMADAYFLSGELEPLKQSYLKIMAEDPSDSKALIGLTRISVVQGDFKKAELYLKSAETAGVRHEQILFERAAMCFSLGNIDEARMLLERLLQFQPNNVEALFLQFLVLEEFASRDADDATRAENIRQLRRCCNHLESLSNAKDDFRMPYYRGRLNKLEGKWAEARDDFILALGNIKKMNPTMIQNHILEMDFRLEDKTAAKKDAKAILSLDPDHAFANYVMGSLALESLEYEAAEDYLQRSLERSPDEIMTLNDLAWAKYCLHKGAEAEDIARKAISKSSELFGVWDTLGCVLLSKKKYDEAAKALETALNLSKSDPSVHLHYAQVLFEMGEYTKVREIVNKLREVESSFVGIDKTSYQELQQNLIAIKR